MGRSYSQLVVQKQDRLFGDTPPHAISPGELELLLHARAMELEVARLSASLERREHELRALREALGGGGDSGGGGAAAVDGVADVGAGDSRGLIRGSVRLVLQRCDSGALLVADKWALFARAVVVYVGFSREPHTLEGRAAAIEQAAAALLHAPLLPATAGADPDGGGGGHGAFGDEADDALARQPLCSALSLLIRERRYLRARWTQAEAEAAADAAAADADGAEPPPPRGTSDTEKEQRSVRPYDARGAVNVEASEDDEEGGDADLGRRGTRIVIVPQAALVSELENGGGGGGGGAPRLRNAAPQYHEQLEGAAARGLYERFVSIVRSKVTDALAHADGAAAATGFASEMAAVETARALGAAPLAPSAHDAAAAVAIPPRMLFRCGEWAGRFGAFDERGVPSADARGQPLTMAERKRLKKVFDAHTKSHDQLKRGPVAAPASTNTTAAVGNPIGLTQATGGEGRNQPRARHAPPPPPVVHAGTCVVAGEYSARQGLRLDAEIGPMAHVFSF